MEKQSACTNIGEHWTSRLIVIYTNMPSAVPKIVYNSHNLQINVHTLSICLRDNFFLGSFNVHSTYQHTVGFNKHATFMDNLNISLQFQFMFKGILCKLNSTAILDFQVGTSLIKLGHHFYVGTSLLHTSSIKRRSSNFCILSPMSFKSAYKLFTILHTSNKYPTNRL